jgi:hypothetical protein
MARVQEGIIISTVVVVTIAIITVRHCIICSSCRPHTTLDLAPAQRKRLLHFHLSSMLLLLIIIILVVAPLLLLGVVPGVLLLLLPPTPVDTAYDYHHRYQQQPPSNAMMNGGTYLATPTQGVNSLSWRATCEESSIVTWARPSLSSHPHHLHSTHLGDHQYQENNTNDVGTPSMSSTSRTTTPSTSAIAGMDAKATHHHHQQQHQQH